MVEVSTSFIDKYEVVSTLGRGSMGVVYKGRDPEIGRLVAIKTLKSVFLSNDDAGNEALQRFRQESRSAGKLNHPNIVTIFEAGRAENGAPYIVMEFIEGRSVEVLIAEQGALEPLLILHTLIQIANAIDYAHSQNVIHRDIKPSNIIIDGKYVAHLLDFGVAKLNDTSLTPAGNVVGTPGYMSPEQIRGAVLDGKTDLFSLGVVAFEMLTGVRPFPGNEFTTVVSNIIHKEPLSFAELKVELPAETEEVLRKSLAKTKDERYSSGMEFINSLAKTFNASVDAAGLLGGYHPDHKWKDVNVTIPKTINAAMPISATSTKERAVTSSLSKEKGMELGTAVSKMGRMTTQINNTKSPVRSTQKLSTILFKAFGLGVFTAAVVLFGYYQLVKKHSRDRSLEVIDHQGREVSLAASSAEENIEVVNLNIDESKSEIKDGSSVIESQKMSEGISSMAAQQLIIPQGGFDKAEAAKLSNQFLLQGLFLPDLDINSLISLLNEASAREQVELLPAIVSQISHNNYVVRVNALKAFMKPRYLSQRITEQAAIKALQDKDVVVRGFAVKVLAEIKSAVVREALQSQLAVEKSEVVIKVLRQSLEKFPK